MTLAKPAPHFAADGSIAAEIDAKIAALGDWRGATLARVRNLIKKAAPKYWRS